MPRSKYKHDDERVIIQKERSGEYLVRRWTADDVPLGEQKVADLSLAQLREPRAFWTFDPLLFEFERLTIETSDPTAAAADFESQAGLGPVVVRVSHVRPRVADIDPTFPYRVLETGSLRIEPFLQGWNAGVIGSGAMAAGHASLADAEAYVRKNDWATVDVLHCEELPPGLSEGEALRTSSKEPGTIGWLLRMTDVWQTRLVVFEERPAAVPLLRRMAAMLVDRGGPAVMIIPPDAWQTLYQEIVHDRPLDWIAASYSQQSPGRRMTLFAGAGREELLRYSIIPTLLASPDVAKEIETELSSPPESDSIFESATSMIGTLVKSAGDVARMLEHVTFEFSEGQGMIPSKHALDGSYGHVKKAVQGSVRSDTRSPVQSRGVAKRGPEKPTSRNVNSAFFREADGLMTYLDQSAPLRRGETVHLGIQIGSLDTIVKTVGRSSLLEEQFRWKEHDLPGLTLEVAVSGLDFEVLGSRVQQLWLPREDGTTDRIFFAVRPCQQSAAAARLRFSLFYRNNLIQSFRMAALLEKRDPGLAVTLLAGMLDLDEALVAKAGNVAWLSSIEYANVPLRDAQSLPPRGLTIVANESAGQKVFTAKGDELFSVTVGNNVPTLVGDLRTTLRDLSAQPGAPSRYRYLFDQKDNEGDPAQLVPTLFNIANLGWQLYSAIVTDADDRRQVEEILGRSEETIHVADVTLGDIVPWSLIYDREIDPGLTSHQDVNGVERPVAHEVCHAAWPRSDGTLPVTECGGAGCLLNEAEKQKRAQQPAGAADLAEETVVCPLRFWGYKHQIEVPVQQTKDKRATDTAVQAPPKRTRPAKIAAAINRNLPLYLEHENRLKGIIASPTAKAELTGSIADRRDAVKNLLKTSEPDIIYLYCHAFPRKTMADGTTTGPNLGFGVETDEKALLAAANLTGGKWQRAPLVFLNGCSTVGFNPYAPSPFVVQLVKTRGAAALIGTEVTVWEILAAEVAESFMRSFLQDVPAGKALRTARRLLLLKNNPLGLVYTLYGRAELTLGNGSP